MSDKIRTLSQRIAAGQPQATQVRGVAAEASMGGRVTVQLGDTVWSVSDLPNRPAAVGDTLVVQERGNSREVIRNITREKNPPATPTVATAPLMASAETASIYDWNDGTQAVQYTRDVAEVVRTNQAALVDAQGKINNNAISVSALTEQVQAMKAALIAAGVVI